MPATIFLSAASLDLEKRRDDLHAVFSGGGLRVLTQGHSFGLAPRDVRDLLVRRIAESDFVCHLAGLGYGAHADHRFPGAHRPKRRKAS